MQFLSLSGGALAACIVVPIVVVILLVVIWYISTRNKLVALVNDVDESFSAMDVHMKKRHDLIGNLVETCKGYSKFEKETLVQVTEARKLAINAAPDQKAQAEAQLTSSLRTLLNAVNESYPELKANGQFNNLSSQLESLEHEIANSRKFFNAKIKIYNNKVAQFPSSIVARSMKLERKSFFEITDISEREVPKVSFD